MKTDVTVNIAPLVFWGTYEWMLDGWLGMPELYFWQILLLWYALRLSGITQIDPRKYNNPRNLRNSI